MKKRYSLVAGIALAITGRPAAQAQTLDPSFTPPVMYAPGAVLSGVEQADGKRVIAGLFKRINGTTACGVARFNTNGTLDASFQQNIGTQAVGHRLRLLSNGQLLLLNTDVTTSMVLMHVGGINRVTLLKINADGTGDPSLDVGTGPTSTLSYGSFVSDVLPLANGKFIVTGQFDHFSGTPANGIVRLLANGTVDPTFDSGTGLNQSNVAVFRRVVELPNGQLLACGRFTSYNGTARNGLLRLNANGGLDTSFEADFTSSYTDIAVQADGKILVRGLALYGKAGTSAPREASIARLLPNGTYDPSFASTYFQYGEVFAYEGDAIQLLPNGQLLLDAYLVPSKGFRTVRLNSDGTLDQTYQVANTSNATIRSVTQLANGQALIEGTIRNINGINDQTLLLLNSNGTIDTSFLPVIQANGEVKTMARQADGKIVVGGEFTEINGQNARRLARFNANGTLDTTFQPGSGFNFSVEDLAVQPDGRILTMTINTLVRFESNGAPDNSFTHLLDGSWFSRVLLLADGRLLVGGHFLNLNNGNSFLREGLTRLLSNGSVDNTFTADAPEVLESMAEQPNGKLIVAGRVGPLNHSIRRLTTTGAEDPTFTGGIFLAPTGQNPILERFPSYCT